MGKEEQINRKIDKAYISSLAFNADECEICLSDEVKKEYELKFENGKFLFVKKRKYPKTYEECCKVLDWNPLNYDRTGYKFNLLCKLQVLLVCRDAYWKIAGDWKPNFNDETMKFIITTYRGDVYTTIVNNYNRVLSFPTEEMRDAFYENFKDLIEECKELL